MKTTVNEYQQAAALFEKLNACHDASLQKLSFEKARELNQDGSLVYPFDDPKDFALCTVNVTLLLNSYKGAKPKQVVNLTFNEVYNLRFEQPADIDYSDVYEVQAVRTEKNLRVNFYSTKAKILSLQLECREVICDEL